MRTSSIFILLVLIISINISYSSDYDFSTLNWQINNISDSHVNNGNSQSKLNDYLLVKNENILKGMKMVLLEENYSKKFISENIDIKIDGYDDEWNSVSYLLTDEAGNTPEPLGDIVLFKCKIDKDYNLYTMHKAVKAISGDANTYYIVYISFQGKWIRVQYRLDGKNSEYLYNGKWKKIDLKFAVKKVGEAIIPLKKIFNECNIALPELLEIRPMIWNKKNGLIEKKRNNIKWTYENMDFTFERLWINIKNNNYALELLLHLVNNDCYIKGDSITLALALANNVIYNIASPETRNQIKLDIIKHFNFYKKLLNWQKTKGIRYRLENVPLIPKLYWAERSDSYETENGILTLKYYNEFIDKIEMLEDYFKVAQENDLYDAINFHSLVMKVFRFVLDKHKYRSDIDYLRMRHGGTLPAEIQGEIDRGEQYINYLGKKRSWNEFRWMNYQHKIFKTSGYTRGCCGTYSRVQAVILKAMGIPAAYLYYVSHKLSDTTNPQDTHLFLKYYNPFFNKWDSIINIKVKRNLNLYLFIYKIFWHHANKNFESYYFENTNNEKAYKNFLDKGIDNSIIEKLFFIQAKQMTGFLFTPQNAPNILPDSDSDGIVDSIELKYGTNPATPDTDGDGYSDLWEIEHGYNPNAAGSPSDNSICAIDGLAARYIQNSGNIQTEIIPLKDYSMYSEAYQVKSISAKILGSKLYIAVTFYNDIRRISEKIHTIQFLLKGRVEKKFNLQIYNNRPSIWINNTYHHVSDIEYMSVLDTEFTIPLHYFKRAVKLVFMYYGYGKKGNTKLPLAFPSKPITITF